MIELKTIQLFKNKKNNTDCSLTVIMIIFRRCDHVLSRIDNDYLCSVYYKLPRNSWTPTIEPTAPVIVYIAFA